jgi:hypothetical protein
VALAGLALAVIALPRTSYRLTACIAAGLSLIRILIWFEVSLPQEAWAPDGIKRSHLNGRMTELGLPAIPKSAHDIRLLEGGLFSKYLYARFGAAPGEAYEFVRTAGGASVRSIGEEDGEIRILSPAQAAVLVHEGKSGTIRYSVALVDERAPWWCPQDIEHGKAYERYDDRAAEGLSVFYDEDAHTVFIYWHIS